MGMGDGTSFNKQKEKLGPIMTNRIIGKKELSNWWRTPPPIPGHLCFRLFHGPMIWDTHAPFFSPFFFRLKLKSLINSFI